jgi:hypothetical protein
VAVATALAVGSGPPRLRNGLTGPSPETGYNVTQPPAGPPPYGQPTPDQPPYGQPSYGQPSYGQPPAQPSYGQPQYGQPPAQPSYGQPQYGQPPAQPSYGQPPYGQPQYGQPPSAEPTAYPPASGAPSYPGAPPAYPGAPSAYPGAAAGYPVAPPKKSRTGLIIGLVIGAVVLLVLCAVGIGALALSNNKGGISANSGTSAPPTTEKHFTGDLRDILIKVPAGAQKVRPNSASEDGTVTLESAASFLYYTQPNAAAQLSSFGYVKGAMVAFLQNGHQVTSALFQFKDSAGANRTYQSIVDGYEKDPTLGEKGVLPGVPNVRYALSTQTVSGLHAIIAYYVRNDLYGSVLYFNQDAVTAQMLAPFVSQQLALLP